MSIHKKFQHRDVYIPSPAWGSDLATRIIELEKLREKKIIPYSFDLFFELRFIFQQLENWASARIEGNQTRLIDALDPDVRPEVSETVGYQELDNLRKAIQFVDQYCEEHESISLPFILELHKKITQNLPLGNDQPGDETPGKLRKKDVEITKSSHIPPVGIKVQEYMEELVAFANTPHPKQYLLLKAAVLHHRFTWIHPFGNGNGRMARLLTYATLQLMGYGVTHWRIINPTAVFYADRQRYYRQLNKADHGNDEGLLEWSDYFIGGLLEEINKIDRLIDKKYVISKLITPALKDARDARRISETEYNVLRGSVNEREMTFSSADINKYLNVQMSPVARSRLISSMKKNGLIKPAWDAKQRYVIQVGSPILIRHLLRLLDVEGFIRDANE